MTKWVYKTVSAEVIGDLEKKLKPLGDQGWEAVGFTSSFVVVKDKAFGSFTVLLKKAG